MDRRSNAALVVLRCQCRFLNEQQEEKHVVLPNIAISIRLNTRLKHPWHVLSIMITSGEGGKLAAEPRANVIRCRVWYSNTSD